MTKIYLTFFFFFFVACSHTALKDTVGDALLSVKSTPAGSEAEGKKIIQNKLNYLKLLFEQSRDPYYGTPKWSEACLKANKVGKIEKRNDTLYAVSELYLNSDGNTGFCPETPNTFLAYNIFAYCPERKEVIEMKIRYQKEIHFQKYNLCH